MDGSGSVLLDGDEWQAYFREFKRSAFRLEVHQTYTMPAEDATVRDFLAGAPKLDGFNAPWHRTIRDHAAAGRTTAPRSTARTSP
ncbi:DUF6879 family protein [Streptomyces sp. NPDC088182]|uniref:DUF6879 family protein n=1 Tax=Streptomyces sp. NPDC088182 TaxID=3365838 RepID=UPI00382BBFE6